MTTLIALATKHAVVVGADGLGTETRGMVNPFDLAQFFDANNGFKLKLKPDGTPELDTWGQIFAESRQIPYNQLQHVNKLFKMGVLPIAVMFTGAISLGEHPVRGIVAEFVANDNATVNKGRRNYTVRRVTERLLTLVRRYYTQAYPQAYQEQNLELLVAGYDKNEQWPTILRVDVRRDQIQTAFGPGSFGIAFGGQMDWIQRIVFGTDTHNIARLIERSNALLSLYHTRITEALRQEGYTKDIPEPKVYMPELSLFEQWDLEGLQADWASFSEQNAIDCVGFFLRVMIQAQNVSAQLPTVGSDVHIAVIRKDGFHPITKEVWTYEGYEVPIPEVGR